MQVTHADKDVGTRATQEQLPRSGFLPFRRWVWCRPRGSASDMYFKWGLPLLIRVRCWVDHDSNLRDLEAGHQVPGGDFYRSRAVDIGRVRRQD